MDFNAFRGGDVNIWKEKDHKKQVREKKIKKKLKIQHLSN